MKFISKSSNLLVILRPGLNSQPLTGTPATPTISVRFKDGVAEVEQQNLIDMMLLHPGFNGDFISAEETKKDPYAAGRTSSEPMHEVTEMKYGTPVSRTLKGGDPMKLTPELQKLVQLAAVEMAKSMLPDMIKETLKGMVSVEKGRVKRRRTKRGARGVKKTEVITPEVATVSNIDTENNSGNNTIYNTITEKTS